MYLSRVEIDYSNRRKTKDLNHLGAYHNWVEQLFPREISTGESSRKLWRIDSIQGKQYLLIVSEDKPDPRGFDLYGVENSAQIKSYDEFLNRLENGQVVRFMATLNPVKSLSTGKASGKRGRVVPHITVSQQMQYLKDKSAKNGFELKDDEFFISKASFETLKKPGKKAIQISKATYEGILTITDIELFREVLIKGLGKKKAYGCGMITVIPGTEK